MKVRTLAAALRDLARGHRFYERQREGLGRYFVGSLVADIDALAVHGGVHRQVFGYHRALSRRFPYAIYYRVEGGEVIVLRVLDCRQDPGKTARALRPG